MYRNDHNTVSRANNRSTQGMKHDLCFLLEPSQRLTNASGHFAHLASTLARKMATSLDDDPGSVCTTVRQESLHHVAKSTPCVDRSKVLAGQSSGSAKGPARKKIGPIVTLLEERAMLSTVQITVASLADSGVGILRAAITQANTANQYVIAITADGTIDLMSALPDLDNYISSKGPTRLLGDRQDRIHLRHGPLRASPC
jgi:hypothetical protein